MKGKRKCSDHTVNIILNFISPVQTTEKWGRRDVGFSLKEK